MTRVPQNRQGKLHLSLRGAPHPLCSAGKHSTKVNWAFGPARPFLMLTRKPTTQGQIIQLWVVLPLVTWVPQNRQGKLHLSLRGAPHPLCSAGKHSTKVNWAFGPARPFLMLTRKPTTQGQIIQLWVVLPLVTWVPQNRQGKLRLSIRGCSAPLHFAGNHSTKVNRVFGPARSFSIVNPRGQQLKAWLYSSELS